MLTLALLLSLTLNGFLVGAIVSHCMYWHHCPVCHDCHYCECDCHEQGCPECHP